MIKQGMENGYDQYVKGSKKSVQNVRGQMSKVCGVSLQTVKRNASNYLKTTFKKWRMLSIGSSMDSKRKQSVVL